MSKHFIKEATDTMQLTCVFNKETVEMLNDPMLCGAAFKKKQSQPQDLQRQKTSDQLTKT